MEKLAKNKISIFVFIFLVCSAIVVLLYQKSSFVDSIIASSNSEVVVSMGKDSYDPPNLNIKQGTKVTFKNINTDDYNWPASNVHPTHLLYPEFDPKQPIGPGEEWSFVFNKVGRWKYHDHLKPYITGVIVVTS